MSATADEHFEGKASGGSFFSLGKLQSAVDKFANTVNQLDRSETKKKNDTSSAGGGGSFQSIGAAANALWTGKRPASSNTWGNGRNGGGATFGGMPYFPAAGSQARSWNMDGNNGGAGAGSAAPPGMSRGMTNGGGATFGGAPMKAAGLGAVYKAAANYGNDKMGIQLGMDAYVGAASMGMVGSGSNNMNDSLRRQAFGSHNQNLNALAANAGDAAAGTYAMTSAAGSPNLMSNGKGRSLLQGAQAMGYSNPTMSYTDAASQSIALNSARTSMAMQQMGLTPTRQAGTGLSATSSSATTRQLLQDTYRSYGKMPTAQQLNASLAEGGKLNYTLSKLPGVDAQAYGQQIKAQAALQRAGFTDSQTDQLFKSASSGDRSAQQTIQKNGGGMVTDAQKLKNLNATRMGRDADVAQAFNDQLSNATDALNKFSKALTDIFNNTGLGTAVGGAGAWGSQISGALGGMGNGMASMAGMYGMARMLGMGGGGGAGGMGAAKLAGGAARTIGGAIGMGGSGAGSAAVSAAGAGLGGAMAMGIAPVAAVGGLMALDNAGSSPELQQLNAAATASRVAGRYGIQNGQAGNISANQLALDKFKATHNRFGYAGGGVVPGWNPGRDHQMVAVAGGEGMIVPEAVQAIGGAGTIHALNSKYGKGRQSSGNNFAGGGMVGGSKGTSGPSTSAKSTSKGATNNAGAANTNKNTTDDADASRFIAAAVGELGNGDTSGPGSGQGNNHNKYNQWYDGHQGDAWCDKFVSYVANKAKVVGKVGRDAYTPDHVAWFKKRGKYHKGGKGIRPGDVMFLGPGNIHHVGIVEKMKTGGGFGTVEGNHTWKVERVNRTAGDLNGYGRPFDGSGNGSAGATKDNGKTTTPAAKMDNSGGGMAASLGGEYGSSEEADNVSAALGGLGGGGGGSSPTNTTTPNTAMAAKNNPSTGGQLPHGRFTGTTYGSPQDIASGGDNGRQASGIGHHKGSVSSAYWPMGTQVRISGKGATVNATVEEYGPTNKAIGQHSPPAIIDLGWKTGQAFKGIGANGTGVLDFQVTKWGKGKHYPGATKGGNGWDLAGGNHIPGWPGYVPVKSSGGGNDTVGANDTLDSVIRRGMAAAGVSGDSWFKGLKSIAQHESGGDIHGSSENKTDSNAKAGHPSKGLMQFIESTFNAHKKKGYETWLNPIDQVVADSWSGGYIQQRYGSIGNVPGLKSLAQGGKYKGYAVGSRSIQGDQIAQLHDKEMVIPASAADTFRNAMMKEMLINPVALGGAGGGKGGNRDVTINIQSITLGKGVPANNAQQFIKEIKNAMEKEDMYSKIQTGDKG